MRNELLFSIKSFIQSFIFSNSSKSNAPETDFEITKDFLLIKSALYNNKIYSFSESFDLLEFEKMNDCMIDLIEKSNSFLNFSQEHSKCSKIGLRPNLIDDVDEV